MRRLHLVELEDLAWFPAVLRDGGTAYLEFAVRVSGHAKLLVPKIAAALKQARSAQIVDLCSGGGGPVRVIADELAKSGTPVSVRLTDFFPNLRAFARAADGTDGRITFETASIDAAQVPARLTGFRTIFNAFHHFRPADARRILVDAATAGRPIGVFEVVSREALPLLALLTVPVAVVLTVPFWKPFRWSWLFWSWVVPVMPLFILWDGVVSWLRIYSVEELQELVADIDAPNYTWDIGTIKLGDAPAHATYLIGMPTP